MVTITKFSVSRKRNIFQLNLICLSRGGRERIIKLNLPFPMIDSLSKELNKVIRDYKNESQKDEIKYIG